MASHHRPFRPDGKFPAAPEKPGLDGLRALAVVAVVVYALNPDWLPGGFLGVEVFLVLSGYLVTSLLVSEFRRFGTVDLRRFWFARARRLLPSMVVLLGAVILLACVFARDALPDLRTDVPFSLLYVANWWLIGHPASSSAGRPPLLLHLWLPAVVAQFCLLWPPVLSFLLRRVNVRLVAVAALFGAAASSWWMGAVSHPHADPTRAFLGTDSHAQGLLIGCALSVLIPPWAPRAGVVRSARRLLGAFGAGALAGLGVLMATVGAHSPFVYPGGVVLADLCAAVLIVMVVHPSTWLAPAASFPPLRWIGRRSYALYLWHWPIIQLTRPGHDLAPTGWHALILRVALIAVAAEVSHRLVERPFEKPAVWAGWPNWRRGGAGGGLWAGLTSAVVAGLGVLLLVPFARPTPPTLRTATATAPPGTSKGVTWPRRTTSATTTPAPTTLPPTTTPPATTPTLPATTPPSAVPPSTLPPAAAALAEKEPILALGDSVMASARGALSATFGTGIRVDAVAGRQVTGGIARLEQYRASGLLAHYRTVVVDLGTNGPLTRSLFNELASLLHGVPNVVFYNTYDEEPWETTTNATLAEGVPAHPGMVEINWAIVAPGSGILADDGAHASPAGATAFASLLDTTLLL